MKTITAIRNRIEKHLSEKLVKLDKDIERIADDFIADHVHVVIATAFGFDKRWTNEHEVHKYFKESPIAKRLQKLAEKAASKMYTAIETEAAARIVSKKPWFKAYKEHYIDHFNSRMHELVQVNAEERGGHAAEREWEALLNSELQDPGVFDRGRERQLRGDDDES